MRITIEDIQRKHKELANMIFEFKKQSESDPLKGGKEITLSKVMVGKTELGTCDIKLSEDRDSLIITSWWGGYGEPTALSKAREIVREFGRESD